MCKVVCKPGPFQLKASRLVLLLVGFEWFQKGLLAPGSQRGRRALRGACSSELRGLPSVFFVCFLALGNRRALFLDWTFRNLRCGEEKNEDSDLRPVFKQLLDVRQAWVLLLPGKGRTRGASDLEEADSAETVLPGSTGGGGGNTWYSPSLRWHFSLLTERHD